MSTFEIGHDIQFYTEYFHAIATDGIDATKNIFKNNQGSVFITPRDNSTPYDVINTRIKQLKSDYLKLDGDDNLLIPLIGQLVIPQTAGTNKYPLVIILHGAHRTFTNDGIPILSYKGYEEFQNHLAKNGIASYSIDLFLVNFLENNEKSNFKNGALDFNQRILLFFLHLKLLKIIAGEFTEPTTGDEFPIKITNELLDLKGVLEIFDPSANPNLQALKDALFNKVDFTKIGFMGHSRGADAVSRVSAYFYKGTVLDNPTFPVNAEVNTRIKKLSAQIGKPLQDSIKCILALEPTAVKNEEDPDPDSKHGYKIDNEQTMFFVGVGTHDEDVALDPVRIYEYPECPKVMIAINGASHKRFNTIWANDKAKDQKDPFSENSVQVNLLKLEKHTEILNTVFGACFIGTVGGKPNDLLYFTKSKEFLIDLPKGIDFQSAWKFGFPFQTPNSVPIDLDSKITAPPVEILKDPFEQDIKSFYIEKDNAGIFTIKIPIDPGTNENLSKYTHYSFRFAKGFDISSKPDRVEQNNFTIQFFENDTPIGKSIPGKDITTVKLRALQAFDEITPDTPKDANGKPKKQFKHSILLQTVEIKLSDHFKVEELTRVNRIEINVIPDTTKFSTGQIVWGSIGGAVLGGAIGAGGALLYISKADEAQNNSDNKNKVITVLAGLVGSASGLFTVYNILKADKNAFVFNDFLLTNRQIPNE